MDTVSPKTINPAGGIRLHGESKVESKTATDEFDRFTDLTRKLVQVPKAELDDKRKQKD